MLLASLDVASKKVYLLPYLNHIETWQVDVLSDLYVAQDWILRHNLDPA